MIKLGIKKPWLLLGCAFLLSGCQKGEDTGNYENGVTALESASYEEAAGEFELSVAEGEKLAESYRGEGIAYLKMGNYQEAADAFSKSLDELEEDGSDEMKIDVLSYQASALYKAEDLKGARDCCDRILEIAFDQDAYFMRGRIYLEQDAYEKARKDFGRMLEDSEDYIDYLNVYRVYEERDMTGDGETFLEEALTIPAEDENDAFERGRIYYYLEDYEHAKEELIQAMNAGHKEAALFLGKVYVELEDIGNARAMYQQYMTDNGESARSYNGLAYCDIAEGNYDGALENIEKGISLAEGEDMQSLLFNEIVAYEGKRDFETAATKADRYLNVYPDDEKAIREYEFLQSR